MHKDRIPEALMKEAVRKACEIEKGIYEKKMEQVEKHAFSDGFQQKMRDMTAAGIETEEKTADERRIMDLVVGTDLLLNTVLFVWYVKIAVLVFQMGLDRFLENGPEELQLSSFGMALGGMIPFLPVYVTLTLIIEIAYLVLRHKRKEPYLTEKFSIVSLILKSGILIALIDMALMFT